MKTVRFGVVVFPGSNCDHDVYYVLKTLLKQDVRFLWHKQTSLEDCDVIILPGGFSYGDYLRCGAIARFSPIMKEVAGFAARGGIVMGICNGFQILCESGLLPGALIRNRSLRFICKNVSLKVENKKSIFTNSFVKADINQFKLPIAHAEGNYICDENTLSELESNKQILFRYIDNPNGSLADIAGIINKEGNVMGMMPHPERACEKLLGSEQGLNIFRSITESFN